ncbi:MAG: hypothetical protein ACTSYC_09360 [Promethearchaeota archaeon]
MEHAKYCPECGASLGDDRYCEKCEFGALKMEELKERSEISSPAMSHS